MSRIKVTLTYITNELKPENYPQGLTEEDIIKGEVEYFSDVSSVLEALEYSKPNQLSVHVEVIE